MKINQNVKRSEETRYTSDNEVKEEYQKFILDNDVLEAEKLILSRDRWDFEFVFPLFEHFNMSSQGDYLVIFQGTQTSHIVRVTSEYSHIMLRDISTNRLIYPLISTSIPGQNYEHTFRLKRPEKESTFIFRTVLDTLRSQSKQNTMRIEMQSGKTVHFDNIKISVVIKRGILWINREDSNRNGTSS